jgi:hypothetical protein
MDLQHFGQIVSVTHVMFIKFKNSFKIDLRETEYYAPLKFQRWWLAGWEVEGLGGLGAWEVEGLGGWNRHV